MLRYIAQSLRGRQYIKINNNNGSRTYQSANTNPIIDLFDENKENTGLHLPYMCSSRCPDPNDTKNVRFERQTVKI